MSDAAVDDPEAAGSPKEGKKGKVAGERPGMLALGCLAADSFSPLFSFSANPPRKHEKQKQQDRRKREKRGKEPGKGRECWLRQVWQPGCVQTPTTSDPAKQGSHLAPPR
ncbi:MAG: hypothetical protein JNG86_20855 [Verrucomicrobiaceae bacterium]|nr:hypothetical protein [Verrucomicrobiaceae bacterium]